MVLSVASSLGSLPDHPCSKMAPEHAGSTISQEARHRRLTPRRRCKYWFHPTPQSMAGALLAWDLSRDPFGMGLPCHLKVPPVLPSFSPFFPTAGLPGEQWPDLPAPAPPPQPCSSVTPGPPLPSPPPPAAAVVGNTRCPGQALWEWSQVGMEAWV